MKKVSFGLVVLAVVVATMAGFTIGLRQVAATQTTWGNIKCQYNPNCRPSPQPPQDADNKNQG